jgi:hypothetical protein
VRPPGAAAVWEILDTRAGLRIGFTAFTADGQPAPWLSVRPCPPDEFAVSIRTDDALATLANL